MNVNINIQKISNGFVMSDGYNGEYIDHSGVSRAETCFYPTLEALAEAAPGFIKSAVVNQETRMREYEERLRAEQQQYAELTAGQTVGGALRRI